MSQHQPEEIRHGPFAVGRHDGELSHQRGLLASRALSAARPLSFSTGMQAHTIESVWASDEGMLHGFCFDCGWPAPQWRRLLGIGAPFYWAPDDERRIIIECARACVVCDGDTLVVAPRPESSR